MTKISRLADAARRRVRAGEDAEQGFTLIELLVVLLIIGILLAIAIPTFLSVTKSANNTAAQSNLQTALTGAKTYYTENNQTYTLISLGPIDTGLSVVTGASPSNNPHVVSVDKPTAGPGTEVALASWSTGTHDCWGIVDETAPLGIYGQPATFTGTVFVEKNNVANTACTGVIFYQAAAGAAASGLNYSTNGFGGITGAN